MQKSKCNILNEDRLQRLLERRLNQDDLEILKKHLVEDCHDCDEIFDHLDEDYESAMTDLFNKLARQQTLNMTVDSTSNVIEFPKVIEDHIEIQSSRFSQSSERISSRKKNYAWVGGVAAMFLVSVVTIPAIFSGNSVDSFYTVGDFSRQHAKGAVKQDLTIDLDFVAGRMNSESGLEISSGINGGRYNKNDLIFLNVDTKAEGYFYVLGYQNSDSIELIYSVSNDRNTPSPAGSYSIPEKQVEGISLAGIEGRYWIASVFSPNPLDIDSEVLPAVKNTVINRRENADENESMSQKHVAVDVIYIDVYDS